MPSTTSTPRRLMLAEEVADFLAVSPGMIRKLARSGALPAIRVGTALRFDPAAVDAYVDARTTRAPDPTPSTSRPGNSARPRARGPVRSARAALAARD